VLTELTTLEQAAALKVGRIDIGFGRLRFEDDDLTRRVIHEERLSVAVPHGHVLARKRKPLKLKHTVDVPLILYPNAPRPSYADQVLSFYRKLELEPKVGFEVRELQTALGLVAADVGIALVPSSVRRLRRDDVDYLTLNEPDLTTPIIMSYRPNDTSPLLAKLLELVQEVEPPAKVDP
jgi:LysR family transcriptional regulator, benzoate and cis,cis-muconate-responsive activator of ben and cat genes